MQVGMAVKNAIKNTKKLEKRMPVKEKKVRDKGLLARTNYAQEEDRPFENGCPNHTSIA